MQEAATDEYLRFIPVLTGNTGIQSEAEKGRPVYPRTHGEHSINISPQESRGGLSPYSRGTLFMLVPVEIDFRFIPVLTGNTSSNPLMLPLFSVYPRTHGEHNCPHIDQSVVGGLSPYSRGTRCIQL